MDSGEEVAEDSAEEGAEGGRNKGESDDDEDENAGIDGSGSDRSEDSAAEDDQQATEATCFSPDEGLGASIDNGNDIERIEV